MRKTPWWVWLLPLPVVWWAALAVAYRWQPGMEITALLDVLNSALAEPFALVSFSEATTPSFAGESKKALASSIERSEKKTKNLAMVRS